MAFDFDARRRTICDRTAIRENTMSTKASIAHGEGFHFYHEALDEDHVFLELETTHYEAGYGRVMVSIPIHIWETIRHLGGARLDLVDTSDDELLAKVQTEVDERIERYEAALRESPEGAKVFRIIGALVSGGPDTDREQQVRKGLGYYRAERRRQQEVRAAIAALRAKQRSDA